MKPNATTSLISWRCTLATDQGVHVVYHRMGVAMMFANIKGLVDRLELDQVRPSRNGGNQVMEIFAAAP